MTGFAGITVEEADGIAHIVLSRPEAGNALDLATSYGLRDAVAHVSKLPDLRAVVLRGEGKRFCVGGDLTGFKQAPPGAGLCYDVAVPLHEAILALGELPIPVVAQVHGAVGGGGVGLVLAADIAVAAESTVFRLGYTGSGLSPDCGVTWDLPHRIGMAKAMDLLLTNRRVSAAEASALGLVSRVVADDDLQAEVRMVIQALGAVPRQTLAETKRLARSAQFRSRAEQLEDEAVTIGRIGDTADTREAINAFLEKRPPVFGSAPAEAAS
jgi:2-(1,2-epoxy-1,2-dihydrophenyl)acetyl-CoA isomerase